MKKTILLFAGLAFLTFKNQAQTVIDIDGNVYNTVTIGTQVWMKENLKVTHYRNGDIIPIVTDNIQWQNLTTGAFCDYDNTPINSTTYGKLYNFYTVSDSRNICPNDWHVPVDSEWTTLTTYLGGDSVAGGKLKETGTTHWDSPNTGADNSSGFTALPGGSHSNDGPFLDLGGYGNWWGSESGTGAWYRVMSFNYKYVYRGSDDKKNGFSVRCVSDFSTNINKININNNIQIYPNPAINKVYIDCAEIKVLKMQVFNIIGDCVFQSVLTSGTNEVDISSLTTGIYVIRLTGADWTIQRKLIKE